MNSRIIQTLTAATAILDDMGGHAPPRPDDTKHRHGRRWPSVQAERCVGDGRPDDPAEIKRVRKAEKRIRDAERVEMGQVLARARLEF